MPALLRNLAQHAGIAAALALAEWRGGTRLSIPTPSTTGEDIKEPRAQAALRPARIVPILADPAGGMSVDAAALNYKLDARREWALKAASAVGQTADPHQGKLR